MFRETSHLQHSTCIGINKPKSQLSKFLIENIYIVYITTHPVPLTLNYSNLR